MPRYPVPGVYHETSIWLPVRGLRTGVPAFLGFLGGDVPCNQPVEVTRWAGFEALAGPGPAASADPPAEPDPYLGMPPETPPPGFLHHAVRGFFENGGRCCYVVRLRDPQELVAEDPRLPAQDAALASLRQGLAALEATAEADLVCFPDAMREPARLRAEGAEAGPLRAAEAAAVGMQAAVVDHCARAGTRFALLDALPEASPEMLAAQAQALRGPSAALYHPWLRTSPESPLAVATVPPSGHVAGIYARRDARAGVHEAPANEAVEGVTDLVPPLGEAEHRAVSQTAGLAVNCLRAFPRRGILVWGARTLAGPDEAAWSYVNVRRLFLEVARWIERTLADTAFEPNGPTLWSRVTRELSAYLGELYRAGALPGSSPAEAYSVRCDAGTNPPEAVEAGMVVTEVKLAARAPHEFVVVRVTHGAGGTQISGPLPG
jgi:hypothetical protein